jgi:hypothetical protein
MQAKTGLVQAIESTNRAAVTFAKLGAALATAASLIACAAQQQREVNAAHSAGVRAKASAAVACATSEHVATCMLGLAAIYGGGGNGDQVPVVQSDLSAVLNSSLLGTVAGVVGQVKQSNNARDVAIAQTSASVAIAQSGDVRQVQTMQAATGASAAIATGGFSAVAGIAGAGFGALGNAAESANASGAANVQALTTMVAAMPPTIQAGGSVTQAGGAVDQSTNGANRVTGNGNETARNILCTATGGNASANIGGFTASTVGATSALNPGYNPMVSIIPAPTSNNCGGG